MSASTVGPICTNACQASVNFYGVTEALHKGQKKEHEWILVSKV